MEKTARKIKETYYSLYYDLIVTDQIPASEIAELFKDKKFYQYYRKEKYGKRK